MRKVDIVRAWKDEEYRLSLTEEERSCLPPHPAGWIELDEAQLSNIKGMGPPSRPTYPVLTCQPAPC
jgi:mersacidin/lichenicidin family type 2 lantibiotic